MILKILNLWQLGKVIISATLLGIYTMYLYFRSTKSYVSLISMITEFSQGHVVITMAREEYEEMCRLSEQLRNDIKD